MSNPALPDLVVGLYSFPKSGNTWLRAIIAGMAGMPNRKGVLQRYVTDSHFGPILQNPWEFQRRNWYFYKSHRKHPLTEHEGQAIKTDLFLYVYRHPLDVFVSYLNFVSRNVGSKAGESLPVRFDKVEDLTAAQMETLFGIYLKHATLFPRNNAFGNIFEHVRLFRELQASGEAVHILRYEDLSDDFEREAQAIADFLGFKGINLERVFKVADLHTKQDGRFFWKRRKENFRNYLTEDQIGRFEEKYGAELAGLGYGPA